MSMFQKLPTYVRINDKKFIINADFRAMIKIEEIIKDSTLEDNQKLINVLKVFYFSDEIFRNEETMTKGLEKLEWFYNCDRKPNKKTTGGSATKVFSYEYDDIYIYSAFLQEYNIDLTTDYVHWWKFRALLDSLKEDNMFVKIKGYRAYSGDDKDMLELKRYWSLPLDEKEEERLNNLYEQLK